MATCAMLGQAAGTAAYVAVKNGITPREVNNYISELQQCLMEDDCWLPGLCRKVSDACLSAELTAECENTDNLRNGIDRPTDEAGDNGCFVPLNSDITYTLKANTYIENVHIVFDSDLNR